MPSVIGIDLFVGREREMAEIVAALDGAVEGRGGLVMLAGEPGIGKTRLTEELAAVAKERGALVTWGACYEDGSAPPYWPWTQAIRSLLTEPSEAVLSALETRAAVIAEIIPEFTDTMPDIQPAPESRSGAGTLPSLRLGHVIPERDRDLAARGPRTRRPALGRPLDTRPAGVRCPRCLSTTDAADRRLPRYGAVPPAPALRVIGDTGACPRLPANPPARS